MQCSVEIGIKIKIETSFKLCSNTTLLISGATAGLVYARNGPLQQVRNNWLIWQSYTYTRDKNPFVELAKPTRNLPHLLNIICSSGVPTGNGELAKSQF